MVKIFRITGFLGFDHRPEFEITENNVVESGPVSETYFLAFRIPDDGRWTMDDGQSPETK
jgi:hypothetical protein